MRKEGNSDILKGIVFLVLIAGLICITYALIYTISESVNRFSDPRQILLSCGLAGTGIFFILMSLNLLDTLKQKMGILTLIGILLSILAIISFVFLYPHAWFYPNVAYVIIAYTVGMIMLLFNIMFHHYKEILSTTRKKSLTENTDRKYTMISDESQISATMSSMFFSQILHPMNEFSMWNSTFHDKEIYRNYDEVIFDGTEKDKNCSFESSTENIPETIFPETIIDVNTGTYVAMETLSSTNKTIENETNEKNKSFFTMKKTDIKKNDHMREAAHKILKYHFGKMLKHERGTIIGKDVEELHDMRVAAMRMRSVLEVFEGHLDMEVMKYFFKKIKATRRTLGTVRDLDVFIEKVYAYVDTLPEDRKSELDGLIDVLLIERDKARGLMLLYLDSTKYAKFKFKFTKLLETQEHWKESLVDQNGKPLPHRVRDVLPSLLYEQLASVRAYDELLQEKGTSFNTLHALRIDVKILRYTLEFFEEVLGEDTKNLVKDLKTLQDNLGDIHDAVVSIELLENYLKSGKWGRIDNKNLGEKHLILSEKGVENYLEYRKKECNELLEAFPKEWNKLLDKDFGIKLSGAIASLYID